MASERDRVATVLAWSLATMAGVPALVAQQGVLLREEICATCTVVFDEVATLTSVDVLGEPMALALLGGNRLLVSFFPDGDIVEEFDLRSGLSRRFASAGQGPGEVSNVTSMQVVDDHSVMVFEPGNGRVSVLSGEGQFLRSNRVAGRIQDAAVTEDGHIFVSGYVGGVLDSPLHLLESDGEQVASFGSHPRIAMPAREPALWIRRVTSDGAARFWSALATSYEIRQWNAAGDLMGWFYREPPWFRPYFEGRKITPGEPFPAWLVDLVWVSDDIVATAIHVAAADWEAALGPPYTTRGGEVVYPNMDVDRVNDTVIEFIDIGSGTVIAHHRIPGYAVGFVDPSHLVLYSEDDLGVPSLIVYSVGLRGR